jgi:hypothetical protein
MRKRECGEECEIQNKYIFKLNEIYSINNRTENNMNQESWSSERELNLLSSECEAGMPPSPLRLSVTRYIISYLEPLTLSFSGSNILHLFSVVFIFTLKHNNIIFRKL